MADFNPQTNRVIAGICEFCGTKAAECPHYKGNPLPTDELKKLENPAFMPKPPVFAVVPPLTQEELAPTLADARQAKADADAKLAEESRERAILETQAAVAESEKPRTGRPPLPRDPVTGEIIRS